LEFLSDFGLTAPQCSDIGSKLLDYARGITASFGILLDTARHLGFNTKFVDPVTNARRRIRLEDFSDLSTWVENFVPIDPNELLPVAAQVLEWTAAQEHAILEALQIGRTKQCRIHKAEYCSSCTPRRFSNGHDLADVLALGLSQRCGYDVNAAEFARATRLATSSGAIGDWDVANRVQRWQSLHAAA
tara:strand:+ start:1931 stop:2494 length:564 start_codon:yes stop_codon:yes gene_type:complete